MSTGAQPDDEEVGTRQIARRLAYTALWTGRFLLGALVLLYGLSFVAPPPVEERSLSYDDDPSAVAADAVHNLRSDTYRYEVTVTESNATDSTVTYRAAMTIDNGARQLAGWIRDGPIARNDSAEPFSIYGTVGSGYGRLSPAMEPFLETTGVWTSDASWVYGLEQNAFRAPSTLREVTGVVRTDNESHYVVSLDLAAVDEVIVEPPRFTRPVAAEDVRLTLAIRKATDRISWAQFHLSNGSNSADYRYTFHRGVLLDVDRPLETYPPGYSFVQRVNLGFAAVEGLIPGGGS